MRIERVGLEHHGDVAILRMQLVDPVAVDADLATGDLLQPCDHPQQRGLPAAGRADEHDEFAVLDVEVDAMQHLHVAVGFLDVPDIDRCHVTNP